MKNLLITVFATTMLLACSDNSQQTTTVSNSAVQPNATGDAAPATKASTTSGGRDIITIVGSSTVYPFSTVVAERFGKTTDFKTPKIESTGTGGGMKLFCASLDINTPDITNASRRIKASEVKMCHENGVMDIVEVLIGYDGIVLSNSKESDLLSFTRRDIFLALAKQVPALDGSNTLVENPYTTWQE